MSPTRLVALGAALVALAPIAPTPAAGQSSFPEREGFVANGTDMALSGARIEAEFHERIGEPYGLDGLVLVVDDCRPDPEVYLDGALVHYGLAESPGRIDDRTLAWLVCLEPRFTGFFWSADNPYAARLDDGPVADAMVDDLRAGIFTGAVVGALDVVAGQLGADAGSGARGQAEAVDEADEAGGGSGWGVLLLVLGLGASGLWWWRRRSRAPAGEASDAGEATRRGLEAKMADLERRLRADSPALARLVLSSETLGDEAILDLNRRHQLMLDRLAELQRQVQAVTGGVVPSAIADAADPAAVQAHYAPAAAEADALLAYADGLDVEADHVESLLERAPVLAVEARKAIGAAHGAYSRDATDLGLPAADAMLALPSALVDEAEADLSAGRRIPAGRLAEDATALAGRVAGLAAGLAALRDRLGETARLFERIDDYAPASWADIRGNGSEAEESLEAAVGLLGRIADSERAAFGADAAAGYAASLGRAEAELERARGLLDGIVDRLAHLERARREATPSLAAVRGEIAEARAWLARPEVDAEVDPSPAAALDGATAILDAAEAATAAAAPDWPAILRSVQAADRAADAAMADARVQQERVAARRRQLEAARTAATAALERAERFLSAHRADAGAAAAARLDDAREAVRRAAEAARAAENEEDAARVDALGAAAAAYERASDLADGAYDAVAADFAAAEKRREPYVPRTTWVVPTVPVSMGGSRAGGFSGGAPRRSQWGGRSSSGGGKSPSTGSRRGGGRGW